MSKLGFSTAKGFHEKVPFAERADSASRVSKDVRTLISDESITIGQAAFSCSLEKNATYIFNIKINDYVHTLLMSVGSSGNARSTCASFYYDDGAHLPDWFLWISFMSSSNTIRIYAGDGTNSPTPTVTATITYQRII